MFPSGTSPDGNAEVVFTPWPEDGVRTGLLGTRRYPPRRYMIAKPVPFARPSLGVHKDAYGIVHRTPPFRLLPSTSVHLRPRAMTAISTMAPPHSAA